MFSTDFNIAQKTNLVYSNLSERERIMRNYKKYIFDLDYTLLIPDWSLEDDYFRKVIPLQR